MKSIIHAATVAALFCAPVFALAQTDAPVTRAEVKGELTQLEQAGYSPSNDETDYPANLQAGQSVNAGGYGGSLPHSTETGARLPLPGDRNSIYFGD
ncbi:MAG: DUF4148 domain-containing protein [Paraburkholderia sp.]|jgi:hypothetical protein|uniref:DUF4148 domain-containing protein n=1 Tax=Burkholderiaceae TaxID=119060 RepID=UPI0010F459E2|nr:DUF4148 domain-containing protein [Burkholderia sp. 4M9327F10]